ncbi:MAG: bifunctional oligoribonuclease/PAP phosphatase NrnA [Lentisphaeria bacterium]|nr:bifunctional oligoribonuclease/PAP phosphatase NrnA [Lentisphaeria bacterium]
MNNLQEAASFLYQSDDFLVVSHVKPDGDAAGSALGMTQFLRDNGKKADVLFADDIPDKFKILTSIDYLRNTNDWNTGKYQTLLVLDCARSLRLNSPCKIENFNGKVINIDHHIDNDVNANINVVCGNASACSSMCADIAMIMKNEYNWHVSKECATLFYLGIVTDTGSFRFSNTNKDTFLSASFLLECSADSEAVINAAFFSKKENQQKFEADMILNYIKRDFNGKYVWAYLPQELFDKYGFDMKDGEGVIEFLRELDGGIISVLIYPKDDTFKVSLRSKDARYPVGPIARSLNGGGHEMASGITARNISKDELIKALQTKIGELFK